jgi:hypothetical protein
MATKKKGILTAPPEWWRHLRWSKRRFWKQERQAADHDAQMQAFEEVFRQDRDILRELAKR